MKTCDDMQPNHIRQVPSVAAFPAQAMTASMAQEFASDAAKIVVRVRDADRVENNDHDRA